MSLVVTMFGLVCKFKELVELLEFIQQNHDKFVKVVDEVGKILSSLDLEKWPHIRNTLNRGYDLTAGFLKGQNSGAAVAEELGKVTTEIWTHIRRLISEIPSQIASGSSTETSASSASSSQAKLRPYKLLTLLRAIERCGHAVIEQGPSGIVGEFKKKNEVVAIKKFHMTPEYADAQFIDELIKLVPTLQHKNIVEHLGYCRTDTESPLYLVSSMEEDNLSKIINGSRNIEWPTHFYIIQAIADGAHYLHQQYTVHLDLKPSNILLDSQTIPKINDFRTARVKRPGKKIRFKRENRPGTEGYMAPELMKSTETVWASAKSDVFSFGILLFQTIGCVCTDKSPRGPKAWASS
ncbi:hypothetical protein ACP4OV_002279 [Aristida adscensionis]